MTIEIANKIRHGRAVGTLWVVTHRDENNSGIVARFDTREEAVAYIALHDRDTWTVMDDRDTWDTEMKRL